MKQSKQEIKGTKRDGAIKAHDVLAETNLTEDECLAIEDARRWAEITPRQINQWVENCCRLCSLIATDKAGISDIAWFWIALFGLFKEVQKYLEELATLFAGEADRVYGEIQSICRLVSDDEHIYIDYLRQSMVHPLPHAIRIKIKKARKAGLPAEIDASYRGREVGEIESSVRSIMKEVARKYEVQEAEADRYVARDLALRLREPLRALSLLVREWSDT